MLFSLIIAQSECYLGHPWCKYWVHMAFLNDKTGKMSKSKGDFLTLSLLEEKGYKPLSYRFYCLQSHYRNTLAFDFDKLSEAENAYNKLVAKITSLKPEEGQEVNKQVFDSYKDKFTSCLENDLNTASAITLIYDVLKEKCNNLTK